MEQKKESAFTLLELLIVITLIGILASIAIIRYGPVQENARRAEAYTVLAEIVTSEKRYYLDKDVYTTTIEDLDTFSTAPTSDNFTFSIPSTDVDSGYAQAARKSTGSGRSSYGMCLQNAKKGSCAADICNPTCP